MSKNTATMNSLTPTGALLASLSNVTTEVLKGRICELRVDGTLIVQVAVDSKLACDWLDNGGATNRPLLPGDDVMVLAALCFERPVVVGRIAGYVSPTLPADVTIHAKDSLQLKCGSASIDLRADGKVMIRGEDVLVRAKGTKRIRAGTVAIN